LTIVFISLEPWDEIWRRNQFICDGLLRRSESTEILFVEPPYDNSYALRCRQVHSVRYRSELYSVSGYDNRLRILKPTKWFPNSIGLGRKLNEDNLVSQIKSAIANLEWMPSHLWINQHEAAHMLYAKLTTNVIYDITDDWTTFSGNQAQLEMVTRQDRLLCERANHVIVCSEKLFADKKHLVDNRRLHLIPNGVHVEHYITVSDDNLASASVASQWTKPIIGYTGTVHSDRVDVDLLMKVATSFPDATIPLVGPNLLSEVDCKRLRKFPNIVLLGPIPYAELPDIMRTFSVCMVPHLVSPFTESLNPIKLWEYLASGKPIVSTNVAGFRDFSDLIFVANTEDEFVRSIASALTEDKATGSDRQAIANIHSWDSRLHDVMRVLND
jgi:teichuronic acid biosynthesis glycosyltransferase TuaH